MSRHEDTPARAAMSAAEYLLYLGPGDLAELRRMKKGEGGRAFWRLAARRPATIGRADREAEWMNIVRILAILTPKGDPDHRMPLHDSRRKLGEVLCDGGDVSWTGPRPVFGEHRLIRLMAARGAQRASLLERAVRFLNPGCRMNVPDIACTLLYPDDSRRLAEPYYRRLDRAERDAQQSEEGDR